MSDKSEKSEKFDKFYYALPNGKGGSAGSVGTKSSEEFNVETFKLEMFKRFDKEFKLSEREEKRKDKIIKEMKEMNVKHAIMKKQFDYSVSGDYSLIEEMENIACFFVRHGFKYGLVYSKPINVYNLSELIYHCDFYLSWD